MYLKTNITLCVKYTQGRKEAKREGREGGRDGWTEKGMEGGRESEINGVK